MNRILDNQTIRIDNHNRGIENNWNDLEQDIHIHKTSNTSVNKREWYEVRIPLRKKVSVLGTNVPTKIKKEIKKIFGDEGNRKHFIEDVYKELVTNWQWHVSPKKEAEIKKGARIVKSHCRIHGI